MEDGQAWKHLHSEGTGDSTTLARKQRRMRIIVCASLNGHAYSHGCHDCSRCCSRATVSQEGVLLELELCTHAKETCPTSFPVYRAPMLELRGKQAAMRIVSRRVGCMVHLGLQDYRHQDMQSSSRLSPFLAPGASFVWDNAA